MLYVNLIAILVVILYPIFFSFSLYLFGSFPAFLFSFFFPFLGWMFCIRKIMGSVCYARNQIELEA